MSWSTVSATPAGTTTQVQYNSGGAFAGSANMVFDGNKLTTNQFGVSGNRTLAAWGTNGIGITAAAATYTDSSTASSTTIALYAIHALAQPTLATTNANIIVKDAATWYITAAPTSVSSQPNFTNRWSAWFRGSGNSSSTSWNNVRIGDQLHAGMDLNLNVGTYVAPIVVYASGQNANNQILCGIDFTSTNFGYLSGGTTYSIPTTAGARIIYTTQGTTYGAGKTLSLATNTSGSTISNFITCSSGVSGGTVTSAFPNFIQHYYPCYFGPTDVVPTALVHISGSTTSMSSLRIIGGTAPTTPNDGDIWYDGTNLKMRIAGTTKTII